MTTIDKATRTLPQITPSNVSDLACAKKFHTLRIEKKWPKTTVARSTDFGTAFHEVMARVYDPKSRELPNVKHLDAIARAAFAARHYADADERKRAVERCIRMVRGYVQADEDASSTIGVEVENVFTVNDEHDQPLFTIKAKLDRLVVRPEEPNHLIVVDYKTTRPRVNLEEAFITLWVARLAFPEFRSAELYIEWIDEDGRCERDVITKRDLKGVHGLVVDKIKRILSATEFPAEPGDACTWCPLRAECLPPQGSTSLESAAALFSEFDTQEEQ